MSNIDLGVEIGGDDENLGLHDVNMFEVDA